MIVKNAKFSYCNVFEPAETPSGDMKYSVSILIPKDAKDVLASVDAAIKQAIEKGLEKGTIAKAHVKGLRIPLRDGTAEHEEGKRGKEYDGFFFMNASSKNKPGIVDKEAVPIFDPNEFYSGIVGHADVNFFAYNQAGNRGVGVGLNNLMKREDGPRLDGRMTAEDAFSSFADTPDTSEGGDDLT